MTDVVAKWGGGGGHEGGQGGNEKHSNENDYALEYFICGGFVTGARTQLNMLINNSNFDRFPMILGVFLSHTHTAWP